jgi:hypothetical protein
VLQHPYDTTPPYSFQCRTACKIRKLVRTRSERGLQSASTLANLALMRTKSALRTFLGQAPAKPRRARSDAPCRFMDSLHFLDTHWDHEPRESPSTALRAPSPPLGEKDGMRGFGSWRDPP